MLFFFFFAISSYFYSSFHFYMNCYRMRDTQFSTHMNETSMQFSTPLRPPPSLLSTFLFKWPGNWLFFFLKFSLLICVSQFKKHKMNPIQLRRKKMQEKKNQQIKMNVLVEYLLCIISLSSLSTWQYVHDYILVHNKQLVYWV